jgi:hypothetical protein
MASGEKFKFVNFRGGNSSVSGSDLLSPREKLLLG